MPKITKDTTIKELLEKYPKAAEVLMKYNLHCFGCPFAMMETIEMAIKAHGLDLDAILKELNQALEDDSEDS